MKRKKIFGISLVVVALALATTIITLTIVPLVIDVNDEHEPIISYATYKTSENNQSVSNNTHTIISNAEPNISNESLPENEQSLLESFVSNPVSSGIVSSDENTNSSNLIINSSNASNTQNNVSSSSSHSANEQNSVNENNSNNQIIQNETTTENTNKTVSEHTHSYYERVVSPTCNSRGYTLHTCDCGNSYADDYQKALGHSWGNWENLSEATVTSKGLQQRVCSRCSTKDYRYIDEIKIDNTANSEFAKKVIELINEERKNNNLPALNMDNTLMKNAYTRATELETNFGHQRPNGEPGYQFALNLGYSTVGENIAAGQETPEAVVKSWMNSAGHRANILNPDYTHIGVGCYIASDGWIYWAQLFGG